MRRAPVRGKVLSFRPRGAPPSTPAPVEAPVAGDASIDPVEFRAAVDLVARLGGFCALLVVRIVLQLVRPTIADHIEDPMVWARISRRLAVAERSITTAVRLLVRSAR